MTKFTNKLLLLALLIFALFSCSEHDHDQNHDETVEKGVHGGRLLTEDDFQVELSIFETGVPPEFRVWITQNDQPIAPQAVELNVKLFRLGNVTDDINFKVEGDFLRGDMEIYEPHSFAVSVTAKYQNKTYQWNYDNFEGRTRIDDEIAKAMEIKTEKAGSALFRQTIPVYGKVILAPESNRQIHARSNGEIKKIHVSLGDKVSKGQILMTIESNESLKTYTVVSPISGIVGQQFANAGEQTNDRVLFEIHQTENLMAELAVFPADASKVKLQANVDLTMTGTDRIWKGTVNSSRSLLRADQARLFLVELDNGDASLTAGQFVTAHIEVDSFEVPLAVKKSGLQGFRDFTVVYAKVDDQYEVRMLELGRESSEWIEVLGGIKSGTEYVTENSYIIKADIEKSGASHDH